jgi:potassium voltage-gated channel Eag-related subfamily H protein 7
VCLTSIRPCFAAQNPQKGGTWAQYWDLVPCIALIYTAIVTPYDVAFLAPPSPSEQWSDTLFLCNRAVDIIFIIDVLFQFRTAYKSVHPTKGVAWITDPKAIALHYVRSSWFYLDVFSILTSLFDIVGGEDTQGLMALRIVRVLRLAKLVRLARGSRILKKWEMSMAINYAQLSLFQIVAVNLIACHWIACIWALQASFNPLKSWPIQKGYCGAWETNNRSLVEAGVDTCKSSQLCTAGDCRGDVCEGGYHCADPFVMYAWSLYYACMTTSSVGYGDVFAEEFNVTEQWVCITIIMTSCALWGYVIGVMTEVVRNSPEDQRFMEELSNLNTFMAQDRIPPETQYRLREYLFEARKLDDGEVWKRVISKLTPSMQLEVSSLINSRWVRMVWYFNDLLTVPDALIMDLVVCLKTLVFPPRELCPPGFMYIVQSGRAFWGGRMKRAFDVWGDDVVLPPDLWLDLTALSATYLCVYTIDARALIETIDRYPEFKARFRMVKIKWTIRRAFVREAETRVFAAGGEFRGRLRPLYAKQLAKEIESRHAHRRLVGASHAANLHVGDGLFLSKACASQSAMEGAVGNSADWRSRNRREVNRELAVMDSGLELRVAEMKAESKPRSSQEREAARKAARFDALESKLEAIERLLKDKIIQKKREALEARGRAHATSTGILVPQPLDAAPADAAPAAAPASYFWAPAAAPAVYFCIAAAARA